MIASRSEWSTSVKYASMAGRQFRRLMNKRRWRDFSRSRWNHGDEQRLVHTRDRTRRHVPSQRHGSGVSASRHACSLSAKANAPGARVYEQHTRVESARAGSRPRTSSAGVLIATTTPPSPAARSPEPRPRTPSADRSAASAIAGRAASRLCSGLGSWPRPKRDHLRAPGFRISPDHVRRCLRETGTGGCASTAAAAET